MFSGYEFIDNVNNYSTHTCYHTTHWVTEIPSSEKILLSEHEAIILNAVLFYCPYLQLGSVIYLAYIDE